MSVYTTEVLTCTGSGHCVASTERMVVSEIGEQRLPKSEPPWLGSGLGVGVG